MHQPWPCDRLKTDCTGSFGDCKNLAALYRNSEQRGKILAHYHERGWQRCTSSEIAAHDKGLLLTVILLTRRSCSRRRRACLLAKATLEEIKPLSRKVGGKDVTWSRKCAHQSNTFCVDQHHIQHQHVEKYIIYQQAHSSKLKFTSALNLASFFHHSTCSLTHTLLMHIYTLATCTAFCCFLYKQMRSAPAIATSVPYPHTPRVPAGV